MGIKRGLFTQLSGFNAVFRIATEQDRKEIRERVSIDRLSSFIDTIADAEKGKAVIGLNSMKNKPMLIQTMKVEDFLFHLHQDKSFFDPLEKLG